MKGKRIWLAGAMIPLLVSTGSRADDPLADLQKQSPKQATVVVQTQSAPVVSPPADATVFAKDQLEQLVGPIALYPDALVAQILMASTYPLQVVQAARWREKNPEIKDAAVDTAAKNFDWDPSVKSLLHFPDVLKRMSDNLDWTQDLGDAVLAQQEEVMAAVQRLRRAAYDAGNLKTSEQQKVIVEETVIKVEPATEVIYVPTYNPTVVYGSYWSYPSYYYPIYSYPPSYWYPPGYGYGAGLIGFGLGVAWGAAIWGDCDWHGGYVGHHGDIDIDRNTNINIDRNKMNKWEHNSANRKGVRYKDNKVADRYQGNRAQTRPANGVDRDSARGYDRGQGAKDRGGDRAKPSTQPADRAGDRAGDRQGAGARPSTQPADRGSKGAQAKDRASGGFDSSRSDMARGSGQTSNRASSNAYSKGGGGFDSAASQRGASSRGTTSYGGGSRSSYGGGSRAGGGGRSGGGGRGGGGRR